LECLPQGIDSQRKTSMDIQFFRALIIHFGQQAKVLQTINMNISKEVHAFHKRDDFVQLLVTVFGKKQPELWRGIGQLSDLRREIS
jgi:hypothetical protein